MILMTLVSRKINKNKINDDNTKNMVTFGLVANLSRQDSPDNHL